MGISWRLYLYFYLFNTDLIQLIENDWIQHCQMICGKMCARPDLLSSSLQTAQALLMDLSALHRLGFSSRSDNLKLEKFFLDF